MNIRCGQRAVSVLAPALFFKTQVERPSPESTRVFHEVLAWVRHYINAPFFRLGKVPVTAVFILKVAVVVLVLLWLSRRITAFLQDRLLTHTHMETGQRYALARVVGYLVLVFGLIIGLQSLGIDLSSLVVVGGALGIGVGFGLQNVVANFVAGLILLTERPVKMGDRIQVGDTAGDVVRIGGRSTWVRTNDNVVIIVPNSEFIDNRVINWTANDRQIRFSLPVGVGYGSDPARVRQILTRVAREHPDVLTKPEPDVLFKDFGDSSLDFELRVWTIRQIQTPYILKSDLYYAIFSAFSEAGIEIPFPQRDVHLKSIKAPLTVTTDIQSRSQ